MKNEQRYNLHRLAEELVTPERFSQPTVEFDPQDVIRGLGEQGLRLVEQPEPPEAA